MAKPESIHCSTEGLSREEVVVLLVRAFGTLKWYVEHLHPMRIVANTPWSAWSYGEVVTVEFDDAGFVATCKYDRWNPIGGKKRLRRNLDRLVEAFASVRGSLTSEAMAADLEELREGGLMELDASTSHANEPKWKDLILFFVPKKDFWATPLLIDISLLVYLAMVLSGVHSMEPASEDLVRWGGNWRTATLGGGWWRLLTCCFVHIGIVHLLLNMYALAMIGLHLEPLLGRWRMFALYAVTGVFASLVSLWWHENTVSAGASGAIFGLYGVFLALLVTDLVHKDVRKQLLPSIGVFVVYNLLYGLKGGVDNAAHIGGLLSGLVMGFATYVALRRPERRGLAWGAIAVPSIALAVAGSVAAGSLPADDREFQQRMERFLALEENGLAMFRLDEGSDGARQLVVLDERSAPAWDSAMVLLEGTLGLDLSPAVAVRRDILLEYTRERIATTGMIRQALTTPAHGLDGSIERGFARIDSLLLDLEAL